MSVISIDSLAPPTADFLLLRLAGHLFLRRDLWRRAKACGWTGWEFPTALLNNEGQLYTKVYPFIGAPWCRYSIPEKVTGYPSLLSALKKLEEKRTISLEITFG